MSNKVMIDVVGNNHEVIIGYNMTVQADQKLQNLLMIFFFILQVKFVARCKRWNFDMMMGEKR